MDTSWILEWLASHMLFDEWAGWLDSLRAQVATLATSALDPSKRLSLLPLLTAALIAAFVFLRLRRNGAPQARRGFRAFLFPRAMLRHPSTRLDLKIMLLNGIMRPANIIFMGITVIGFAVLIAEGLDHLFGEVQREMSDNFGTVLLLGLIVFLVTDLSTYITHRLSHEWPVLWAFHRVHHSAPLLNPLTQQRRHPVSAVLSRLMDLAMVAPVLGVTLYFWNEETGPTVAVIVRWCFGLFALAGGNLRHSHIWLSFGPFERVLVSPAQHQIHHSRAEKHWNCNYGEVLAIWDWMFGTLRVADRPERLRFGLTEEGRQPHRTLGAALAEPFSYAYRLWHDKRRPRRDMIAAE